ncbi:hypothetical protein BDZ89DRAFT_1071540 [Hymenopellis radicata]|nr:hypothetical protein BDZ89DRAFT_1071540 [Hymenopellis radicata]
MSGPPNCWLPTALPLIDSSTSRHHPRICPALLLTRCLSCTYDPSTNVDHILPCPSCGRPSAVLLLALSSGLRQFASFGLLSSVQFDRRRPTIEDGSTRGECGLWWIVARREESGLPRIVVCGCDVEELVARAEDATGNAISYGDGANTVVPPTSRDY